nr:protein HIRA-like isoform X3 [Onthophagus taurus]
MIVLKPIWVKHEDNKPIFSVDIHPKGGRFATGGQGGQGGRIVIWSIAPVLSADDESDSKTPKQLCQMDNHLACVNVVRWSCQGHFLASGGDDKLVMIWKLTGEGSSTIFGGGGKVNIETWKCVFTLNAHTGDVLDLAWASHDGWLASGSVDNTIIIWNAHKFPEKIAVLKGHTAMVKGVTWDPVGKYIASQSDDKTLRVWRTADWTQQEIVSDAFAECSATTHVLRLSWSPDGQYLVSAHAMNGGGPTAQIIERDGWKQDKDFVGHRKAVTCVRFNSNILKKFSPGSPKPQQYCCCAIGSRDRSISVWLTSLKRPLVVVKDVFDDSVLDISWSSNGLYLLACSWDGSVVCIIFTSEEIGVPLSTAEKNSLYERMYGKSLQRNLLNQSFSGSQIIENPEILCAMEEVNTAERRSQEVPMEEDEAPIFVNTPIQEELNTSSVLVPVNQQVETRLPSGKRRITPMFLKPAPSTAVASKETTEAPTINETSQFSSSSPSKSKIVVVQESSMEKPSQPLQKSETAIVNKVMSSCPPGMQINQLLCSEVPGDLPIVKFIDLMEPLKMPAGKSVMKRSSKMKIQVTNSCQSVSKGTLSRLEVFKNEEDKQPIWETYIGNYSITILRSVY